MKSIGLSCALALIASFASAEGYLCKIGGWEKGFIPQLIAIETRDDGTAWVNDPFIASLEREPKLVKVKRTKNGALEMSWNLNMPTSVGPKRVRFRAVFDEDAGSIAMSAKLRHAANHERGTGSCHLAEFPAG